MHNIEEKFKTYRQNKLFALLPDRQQEVIRHITLQLHLTFQEFRLLTEISRDLEMWDENNLQSWWTDFCRLHGNYDHLRHLKKSFLCVVQEYVQRLKQKPTSYNEEPRRPAAGKNQIISSSADHEVFGWCPVASEKTVCCNLRTIDAVASCAFGCSYCTIQTFYSDKIRIEENLKAKLDKLKLDSNRRYHIGTGQSSDALVWGNRNGILDDLAGFARSHPNVLLEFKTKSDNINWFLKNDVPGNFVCSWSLNPQTIIDHEEHFTAGLDKRITAARKVADRGVRVAFHFHPIIIYEHWRETYPEIARALMEQFNPAEVLFISFGSVTFIRPVIKKIRERGFKTKILQMDMHPDPHGKWTYADEIKIEKFQLMYETFAPWRDKVFFYLCMEKGDIWKQALGYVYKSNEEFEQAMLSSAFEKLVVSKVL